LCSLVIVRSEFHAASDKVLLECPPDGFNRKMRICSYQQPTTDINNSGVIDVSVSLNFVARCTELVSCL